jgi:hypothetical protein
MTTRPHISIAELYELKNKKIAHRVNSFDVVLEKAHGRMRTSAKNGGLNVFFEVPALIMGIPLYNFDDCIAYVVDSLRKNGFLVQLIETHKGVLYISWDQQEIVTSANPRRLAIGRTNGANAHSPPPGPPTTVETLAQLGTSRPFHMPPTATASVNPPQQRRYLL